MESDYPENLKVDEPVKKHLRNSFPLRLPLRHESLLVKKREEKLFGHVQCDLEAPDGLKYKFSNFHQWFKNFKVSGPDLGYYIRDCAIDNNLLKQPQRMLISSSKLAIGSVITLLCNFYLSFMLNCTKIGRFCQYTPKKCCNKIFQSNVDARRAGD